MINVNLFFALNDIDLNNLTMTVKIGIVLYDLNMPISPPPQNGAIQRVKEKIQPKTFEIESILGQSKRRRARGSRPRRARPFCTFYLTLTFITELTRFNLVLELQA